MSLSVLTQKRPAPPDVWLQLLDHALLDPNMPQDPETQQPIALAGLAALLTGARAEAVQAALLKYQQLRVVRIGDAVGQLIGDIEHNVDWQQEQLERAAEQGVNVEPLQDALLSVLRQLREVVKLYPEGDGFDDGFHELDWGAGYDSDCDW